MDHTSAPKIGSRMKETRWLLLHIRPYTPRVVGSLGLIVAAGIVATLDPLLMKYVIDRSFPNHHYVEAAVIGALIALCFAVRAALSGKGMLWSFRVTQAVGQDLRRELLQHMTRLSADWHEKTVLGDKLSRFNTDVEQIAQFGSDAANMIVRSSVLFCLNLVVMLRLSAGMTLTLLPLLPVFYMVRRRFRSRIQDRAREAQEGTGWAIGRITEHLGGVVQLQLLGATNARIADSVVSWAEVVEAQWQQRRTEISFTIAISCVLALAILVAQEVGIHEFAEQELTLGTVVAFYAYITRIFEPVSSGMELYARAQRMLASARRVLEILDEDPSVPDAGTCSLDIGRLRSGLRMNEVFFRYADRYVLRNISLDIHPGEIVAIVGMSGSGKSSLARLFVRLADPSSGSLLIDGRPVADYSLASLRRSICYVPQAPTLFEGTIRENILCGRASVAQSTIDEVLVATRLESVVARLKRGLDHRLYAGAAGLSGGEQQRLAIARALVRDAAVLVLDESTAALDAPTETSVLQSIRRLRPDLTLIVISHRVKALNWIDRFLVLENGLLIAQGNHQNLYAECSHYRLLLAQGEEETHLTFLDRINSIIDQLQVPDGPVRGSRQ